MEFPYLEIYTILILSAADSTNVLLPVCCKAPVALTCWQPSRPFLPQFRSPFLAVSAYVPSLVSGHDLRLEAASMHVCAWKERHKQSSMRRNCTGGYVLARAGSCGGCIASSRDCGWLGFSLFLLR